MEPKTLNEGTDGLVHQTCDGGGGSSHTKKEKAMSMNGSGRGGGDQFPKEPFKYLANLFNMVNDPQTNELISWGASRTSFIIRNHNKFAEELLPHKNFASVIHVSNNYVSNRQLFLPTVRV
ncbi:hypothetical protein Vadar_002761 [Vaccinium darrowii]|uniref:Uncharacterized protein n=1 Tax=Vaccinium darrowii TaxID=229202 RepID=A0ACB7WXE1_9ERIC|nr:hypothetical protein Vadar_002761 [Vaccinium darrowii]